MVIGSRVAAAGGAARPAPPPNVPLVHTPFLWDHTHGTRDLRAVLQASGVQLGDMVLGEPIALAANGSAMVGRATCGDQDIIYRAMLPWPERH